MIATYVWYAFYAKSSITYHDGRSEIFLEGSEHYYHSEGLQLPQGVYNFLGKKHRPILGNKPTPILGFLDRQTSSINKPSPILGFLDQQTPSIFVKPTYSSGYLLGHSKFSIYDKQTSRYSPPRYTASSARHVVRPTKSYAVRVKPSRPARVHVNPSKRLG
ncbi:hypothetical protein TKK_0004061 [Trichogramma kaykai]|uniref:Uncharacterized protein n=1 Tax=Trichogramma kaykai TaxID=54128 RepID=A0ABD2XPT9_9HYME